MVKVSANIVPFVGPGRQIHGAQKRSDLLAMDPNRTAVEAAIKSLTTEEKLAIGAGKLTEIAEKPAELDADRFAAINHYTQNIGNVERVAGGLNARADSQKGLAQHALGLGIVLALVALVAWSGKIVDPSKLPQAAKLLNNLPARVVLTASAGLALTGAGVSANAARINRKDATRIETENQGVGSGLTLAGLGQALGIADRPAE